MSDWTQPQCDACWDTHNPTRVPFRMAEQVPERCAWCGDNTMSGIWVRADPDQLPYPTREIT